MRILPIITLCATALTLSISSVSANSIIDKRQDNQRARIHQGIKSGSLTKGEVLTLRHEQRQIHKARIGARADGSVTSREKARIMHKQNVASRHIARQKHDAQEKL